MAEKEQVDAYYYTLKQLEPDVYPVDQDAALTSIAISLKRIADAVSCQKGGYTLNDLLFQILVNSQNRD